MSVTANPRINPVVTYEFETLLFGATGNDYPPYPIFNTCPSSRRREWSVSLRTLQPGTISQGVYGVAQLFAAKSAPTFARTASRSGVDDWNTALYGLMIATPGEWAGASVTGAIGGTNGLSPWGQLFLGGGADGILPLGGYDNGTPGPTGAFAVSPDGRWVVGTTGANALKAYPVTRFSGLNVSTGLTVSTTAITDPVTAPTVGTINSVAFSPDGLSVVVGGGTSPFIEAWAFDPIAGAWGSKASAPGSLPAGAVNSVRFSPDGTMIAAGHANSPFVALYAWTGTAFGNKASNPGALPAALVNCVAWHPSSTYLLCAVGSASTTANTRTYPITGGATPAFGTAVTATLTSATAAYACAWAGDGNQVAVGMSTIGVNFVPWTGSAFGTAYNNSLSPVGSQERTFVYDKAGVNLYVAYSTASVKRVWTVSGNTSDQFLPPTILRSAATAHTIPVDNSSTSSYNGPAPTVQFDTGPGEEVWARYYTWSNPMHAVMSIQIREYDL